MSDADGSLGRSPHPTIEPARMDEPSATTAERLDLLLILRGLAAISVVVWHLEGYKAEMPSAINTPGRTAVWIFFGISGYVIAYGFVHRRYRLVWPDLRNFFINRFLRIYPLFVALSLLAFVTLSARTGAAPIGIADIPAQLLAVQFNQSYVLSGVFWTLGVELQFYAAAPLLVVPLLVRGRAGLAVAAGLYGLMVYAYSYAVAHSGWSYDGRNIISNLPHFFVGMIACRLVAHRRVPLPAWLSLPAAIGLVGCTSWLYHAHAQEFWSVTGILLVDAAILFFVLAHSRLAVKTVSAGMIPKAFTFLGVLSYGIYGWHAYFVQAAPRVGDHLFLLLALSIAAAYGSYRLIEAPALRLKRYSRRPHTVAVDPQSARSSR
jgi:peptidoglycan/LPS O-acetylase OafA/YrhL